MNETYYRIIIVQNKGPIVKLDLEKAYRNFCTTVSQEKVFLQDGGNGWSAAFPRSIS